MELPETRSFEAFVPEWVRADLEDADRTALRRRRVVVERPRPGWLTVSGREYLDLCSNDYLGLSADPRIGRAVVEYLHGHAWGAAAAPLISGYQPAHARLEATLADFFSAGVLLFGSGYAANTGVIAALAGPSDVLFCEKRSHASIVDGCRLSKGRLQVYRSGELEVLERRLCRARAARRRFIVTDSVFSMEGDKAPLGDLCALAERTGAVLYVDEAHAVGVLGPNGRGLAEELGLEARIPLRMATLGKAFGGAGAFIIAAPPWIDWLIQSARSYVYSTALPPACAVAAHTALEIVRAEPERRHRVLELAERLRRGLVALGHDTRQSQTPIIPLVAGTAGTALTWAERLRAAGFWATAIRPPTVPAGAARLRLSLSAAHTPEDVERLLDALATVTRPHRGTGA